MHRTPQSIGSSICPRSPGSRSPMRIADALSAFGIRHLDMPFTAQKVWAAMQSAKGGQA